MKKIIYSLLALIIIVVVILVFAFDTIGKKYAQYYAQNILKTPVYISQFNSNFLDKSLNIDFIEVQNPPNFNHKNALSLSHFFLKIGDETHSDLTVIDVLKLQNLVFVLEQNNTGINLTKLIKNVEKSAALSTTITPDTKADYSDKRIKINLLKVDDIVLKVDTKWLKTTLKVPNISVKNFGGGSGVKTSEIGAKIAQTILHNLKKSLEKQGIKIGQRKIKTTLMHKLGDKLGIDNLENTIGTDTLKEKGKSLLKNFGF